MTKHLQQFKDKIIHLYLRENRTLKKVMAIMEKDHALDAGLRTYRQYLRRWKVRKNRTRYHASSRPSSQSTKRFSMDSHPPAGPHMSEQHDIEGLGHHERPQHQNMSTFPSPSAPTSHWLGCSLDAPRQIPSLVSGAPAAPKNQTSGGFLVSQPPSHICGQNYQENQSLGENTWTYFPRSITEQSLLPPVQRHSRELQDHELNCIRQSQFHHEITGNLVYRPQPSSQTNISLQAQLATQFPTNFQDQRSAEHSLHHISAENSPIIGFPSSLSHGAIASPNTQPQSRYTPSYLTSPSFSSTTSTHTPEYTFDARDVGIALGSSASPRDNFDACAVPRSIPDTFE